MRALPPGHRLVGQLARYVVVVAHGPIGGDVEHVKLIKDRYLLVTCPGSFPDGPVRLRQLDGGAMVAWPSACDQPRWEQALLDSDARPRVVFRSEGNETILSMVRAGLGFAVLPWLAVHGASAWSDDGLRIHELSPSPAREVFLHWPAGRTQSPLATRAIEIAREVAGDLAERM